MPLPAGQGRGVWYAAAAAALVYVVLLHWGLAQWQEQLLSLSRGVPGNATSCEVAIALGYALQRDGTPTAPLERRVEAAVKLYQQGLAQHLLFSGGHPGGGLRVQSEARAMWQYAERLTGDGIPAEAVVLEERSTSTRTNAVYSLAMIQQRGWRRGAVATNPFHQFRALRTFQCAAKSITAAERPQLWLVYVAPEMMHGYGPLLDGLLRQYDVMREFAAIVYYWFRGWLC